jgi:hypothetical protein
MPIFEGNSEKQLQLEGATLTSIDYSDGLVVLGLEGADIHYEDHLQSHKAQIILAGGHLDRSPQNLPCEISDCSISLPGIGSYSVFVRLPFSLSGACHVELSLVSGECVTAHGSSCRISLGVGTRHAYHFGVHNGT